MPDSSTSAPSARRCACDIPRGSRRPSTPTCRLTGPVAAPLLSGRVDVLYAAVHADHRHRRRHRRCSPPARQAARTGEEARFEAIPESSYPLTFNIQIRANHTLHIDNRKTATLDGQRRSQLSRHARSAEPDRPHRHRQRRGVHQRQPVQGAAGDDPVLQPEQVRSVFRHHGRDAAARAGPDVQRQRAPDRHERPA